MRSDHVRNKDILGPVALLEGHADKTLELLGAQRIRLVLERRARPVHGVSRLLGRGDGPVLLLLDMVAPRYVGEVILLLLRPPHDGSRHFRRERRLGGSIRSAVAGGTACPGGLGDVRVSICQVAGRNVVWREWLSGRLKDRGAVLELERW